MRLLLLLVVALVACRRESDRVAPRIVADPIALPAPSLPARDATTTCPPWRVTEKQASDAVERYLWPTAKRRAASPAGYGFMEPAPLKQCCTVDDDDCAWLVEIGFRTVRDSGDAHFERTQSCAIHAHTGDVKCGATSFGATPPKIVGNVLDGATETSP